MSDKDKDKVLDICRRIERALQRDWGSTGTGLRQRLRTTRYAVPPELRKRILYLRSMQKQALHKERFKLKSAADFEAKGEQVLEELADARKTAARRLQPWLMDLVARHRFIVGTAVAALLVTVLGLGYLLYEPEPPPQPVAVVPRPAPKPAPKLAPKPAPKPAMATTPAPAPVAEASAPVPAAATAAAPAPAPVVAMEPAPLPAGTKVHIEAPSQVTVTLKRAEVVQGTSGRDEITVIVDVQNIGYASLKRMTFDAWLYDASGTKPVALITPSAQDAAPWHAFLRQEIKRGQSAEVRLNYGSTSQWSSAQAVELVNSGRYQIRLKAVSLTDGANQSLPL